MRFLGDVLIHDLIKEDPPKALRLLGLTEAAEATLGRAGQAGERRGTRPSFASSRDARCHSA